MSYRGLLGLCWCIASLSEGELRLLSTALRLRAIGRAECNATKTIVLLKRFTVSPHPKRWELVAATIRLV
jgi:hypothetical protein